MVATKEAVEALIQFRNYINEQMDMYEKTKKTYYYPTPENIISELDARIDDMNDELYLNTK